MLAVPLFCIELATDDPPPCVAVGAYGTLHIERSPEALARLLRARSRGQSVEVGLRSTICMSAHFATSDWNRLETPFMLLTHWVAFL